MPTSELKITCDCKLPESSLPPTHTKLSQPPLYTFSLVSKLLGEPNVLTFTLSPVPTKVYHTPKLPGAVPQLLVGPPVPVAPRLVPASPFVPHVTVMASPHRSLAGTGNSVVKLTVLEKSLSSSAAHKARTRAWCWVPEARPVSVSVVAVVVSAVQGPLVPTRNSTA